MLKYELGHKANLFQLNYISAPLDSNTNTQLITNEMLYQNELNDLIMIRIGIIRKWINANKHLNGSILQYPL